MKNGKKVIKTLFVVLILLMVSFIVCNHTWATWVPDFKSYENGDSGRAGEKITQVMGAIINIMSTIGAGIAIIMLVVIGIQYVSKGAEGKAEAKKDLTGYIVGAVILFGVSGILKILQMFIEANLNNV